MDAYYQQWGMEDDGDPVVSGWWTAALFEKASFGCLAWKGMNSSALLLAMPAA